jgi:hypothetical protein
MAVKESAMYTLAHAINIGIHVGAGTAGIGLGLAILGQAKGTARHKRTGWKFAACGAVVCGSAALGNLLFGFRPLFAALALLVGYQLAGGLRVAARRDHGPAALDGALTVGAAAAAVWLSRLVAAAPEQVAVTQATLGALATLLAYDAARWLFPRRWHAAVWRYEHIYKMTACLFGMMSAASGNLLAAWQPWSQLIPSAAGMVVIIWLWWATGGSPGRRPAPVSTSACPPPSPSSSR